MMPAAGQMDRRVILRRPAEQQDAIGEPSGPATVVATCWAQLIPRRGREVQSSARDVAEAFDLFRIRWRPGVDEGLELVLGVSVYQVHMVTEIGRREGLELLCRKVR